MAPLLRTTFSPQTSQKLFSFLFYLMNTLEFSSEEQFLANNTFGKFFSYFLYIVECSMDSVNNRSKFKNEEIEGNISNVTFLLWFYDNLS